MKNLEDLFNLINKSTITLIGYTFKDERIKDELISNLNYFEVDKIDSSFSIKPILRDLRINSILECSKKSPDYILIDTGNILYDSEKIGSRQQSIRKTVEKLQNDFYSEDSGSYPQNPKIKIIISQPTHRPYKNEDILRLTGGDITLYLSDLAITITNNKIKVVKNRFGSDNCEFIYKHKQMSKF